MSLTKHFKIESVYRPGCLGRMIALQAEVYHPIFGVGQAFEISRANDMAKFFSDYKSQRDGFFLAVLNGEVVGSIVIDGREQDERGPELRWFALDVKARGYGIGKRLLHLALESCQNKGYEQVHLVTHARLETALHLYKQAGFHYTGEFERDSTVFQTFALYLPKPFALNTRPDPVLVTH
jgi:ribosomal protein S18 acetylase RimI-like enzyme